MRHVILQLQRFGLSDKEARVYLAALELGGASAQDIAQRSGVSRATTYAIIDMLVGRELLLCEDEGKRRCFVAHTPEKLRAMLMRERQALEEKERRLDDVIPMLLALFNAEGERPSVRYLEGEDGLASVREAFLKQEGDFVQIVPYADAMQVSFIARDQDRHLERFRGQADKARVLLVGEQEALGQIPDIPNMEVRAVPPELCPIHAEIAVRGSTVYLFSYGERLLGVILTGREIAGAVRGLFDLAWKGAEGFPGRAGF